MWHRRGPGGTWHLNLAQCHRFRVKKALSFSWLKADGAQTGSSSSPTPSPHVLQPMGTNLPKPLLPPAVPTAFRNGQAKANCLLPSVRASQALLAKIIFIFLESRCVKAYQVPLLPSCLLAPMNLGCRVCTLLVCSPFSVISLDGIKH